MNRFVSAAAGAAPLERAAAERLSLRLGGGFIPPLGLMWAKMHDDGLPNTRPMDFRPSPFFQRSHSSALWAAVNPTRRYLRLMTARSTPLIRLRVAAIS